MNRVGRASIMLSLGAIMARLLWSGGFGWFVQQRMKWPLLGATAVLMVFGVYEAVAGAIEQDRDPETGKRSAGPGVGWMLLLPLIVLISVAPTGLGAAAADRVEAYTPVDATERFTELDDSDGPIELRVLDFVDRALCDEDLSLEGRTIRLEGLVVTDPDLDGAFKLTRFIVSCCAADGIPVQVTVHAPGALLENDMWVVAYVVWRVPEVPYRDTDGPWIVEADAVDLTVVPDAPNDPYESPF